MQFRIFTGDSFWLDISTDITGIDATWPGTWSGTFVIVDDLTAPSLAAPLLTGNLIPYDGVQLPTTVAGKFRLAINKTQSATIPAGVQYLIIKVVNDSTGYSEIIYQDKFAIAEAGL